MHFPTHSFAVFSLTLLVWSLLACCLADRLRTRHPLVYQALGACGGELGGGAPALA